MWDFPTVSVFSHWRVPARDRSQNPNPVPGYTWKRAGDRCKPRKTVPGSGAGGDILGAHEKVEVTFGTGARNSKSSSRTDCIMASFLSVDS